MEKQDYTLNGMIAEAIASELTTLLGEGSDVFDSIMVRLQTTMEDEEHAAFTSSDIVGTEADDVNEILNAVSSQLTPRLKTFIEDLLYEASVKRDTQSW